MKIATKILAIVGGVVVVAAIGISSKSGQEPQAAVGNQELSNCRQYSRALSGRASACRAAGFDIEEHWSSRTIDGRENTQTRMCLASSGFDFWKRDRAGAKACADFVGMMDCSLFEKAQFLDSGRPCVQ